MDNRETFKYLVIILIDLCEIFMIQLSLSAHHSVALEKIILLYVLQVK